jgi:hypothetical protein
MRSDELVQVNNDNKVTDQSLKTINCAGKKIVSKKKAEYLEAQEHGMENKDLLTLLSKFVLLWSCREG